MEESLLHAVQGYMYPNEVELQWSVLIVLYPFITGLVAVPLGEFPSGGDPGSQA